MPGTIQVQPEILWELAPTERQEKVPGLRCVPGGGRLSVKRGIAENVSIVSVVSVGRNTTRPVASVPFLHPPHPRVKPRRHHRLAAAVGISKAGSCGREIVWIAVFGYLKAGQRYSKTNSLDCAMRSARDRFLERM